MSKIVVRKNENKQSDIDIYGDFKNYIKLQMLRPDYAKAISTSIDLAIKNTRDKKNVDIADFCCGIGSNTRKFSIKKDVNEALLVDINKGFLNIATKSKIKAKKVKIINQDILSVDFTKKYDIVFSIFAYHHVKDEEKILYIEQIKKCLKPNGILILTEIYLSSKGEAINYYKNVLESIQAEKRSDGLKRFLHQTANSTLFEFKVSKKYSDSQFRSKGLNLIEEVKIWPKNDKDEKGTYVQVYRNN